MVIARLMGGMGNQLFQYAAGRVLAEKHGVDLAFDKSFLEKTFENVTPRSYSLGSFRIRERFATDREVDELTHRSPGMTNLLKRAAAKLSSPAQRSEFYEKSLRFDPAFFELGGNVYLSGYFQSEKYFSGIRDLLLKDVRLREPMSAAAGEVANQIGRQEAPVSIHVRRGDYATNPAAAQYHGVLPVEYFREAIARVRGSVSNPHFFVFSDEPEWAESHLGITDGATVVRGAMKDAEDLMLISACRHHIISNSSFSWWGAWLSGDDKKLVVAPRKWFADPGADSSDIVPDGWLRV